MGSDGPRAECRHLRSQTIFSLHELVLSVLSFPCRAGECFSSIFVEGGMINFAAVTLSKKSERLLEKKLKWKTKKEGRMMLRMQQSSLCASITSIERFSDLEINPVPCLEIRPRRPQIAFKLRLEWAKSLVQPESSASSEQLNPRFSGRMEGSNYVRKDC